MQTRAPRARQQQEAHEGWKRTLVLLTIPFLVRAACFLELSGKPFFECLFVDARTYHDMAVALANRTFQSNVPFWQPPGYPLFLGIVYRIFGTDPNVARWIQIGLGSISAWLVFRITCTVFGPRAAWIAWVVFAFYGPIVLYDLQLLSVNLGTLFFLLAIWMLLGWRQLSATSARWTRAGLGGLAAGLATVTIGNMGLLIPLGTAWLLWNRRAVIPTAVGMALFLLASEFPITAATLYNRSVSGESVVISYNAGVNFWIGNNPDYESTVGIRPGRAWIRLTDEPRQNGHLGYRAQSRYFFEKARRWIESNPGAYLRLLLHKGHLFLRGDEILRNQELYPFRDLSRVAGALLWVKGLAFPWGLVLPLAMAGVVLALGTGRWFRPARAPSHPPHDFRAALFLFVVAVAYAASVIAFFVTARYRLPVVAIAVGFAGFAIDRTLSGLDDVIHSARNWRARRRDDGVPDAVVRRWGTRSQGVAIAAAATLGIVAAVANLGVPAPRRDFNSDAHYDLGYWYQLAGDRGMAKEHYEHALEIDSNNHEARNNLAGLLVETGELGRAADLLVMVLAAYPHDARVLRNLGSIRLRQGRPYEAGWCFRRILSSDPADPRAQMSLAEAEQMAGELEERRLAEGAEEFLSSMSEASRLSPENEFLRERLERLRLAHGKS